uniref:Trypanosoma vivax n=1 Tax=Trypanosoma vivax (strain Y486) TaxID=1055687 RepID=G0TY31_TRYVY|nr:hypothetical protein TVY486_0702130 [Trypanosoma vivax Y486]
MCRLCHLRFFPIVRITTLACPLNVWMPTSRMSQCCTAPLVPVASVLKRTPHSPISHPPFICVVSAVANLACYRQLSSSTNLMCLHGVLSTKVLRLSVLYSFVALNKLV